MGQTKSAISLDPAAVQSSVDGLLCRAQPTRVGSFIQAATQAAVSPPVFLYCNMWDARERLAFWTGFLDRMGEFGHEFELYYLWFKRAFLFGDEDGDFEKAWKSFGSGLMDLAQLAWKLCVVAGVPPPMMFHPSRDEYAAELRQLGLAMTQQFIDGYKKSYAVGGIPQCTGRLYADLIRIVIELLAAKGAGKLASGAAKAAESGKVAQVLERLPGPLKTLPEKLAARPTRFQLIEYIRHDATTSIHARGVLHDLKPGQILLRVEERGAPGPGNWFNGPFKNLEDAQKYAKYLADLGEEGIRRESALPNVWSGGHPGNKVEVIRFYKVVNETPAIGSHAAPQVEGIAKAATDATKTAGDAAKTAGNATKAGAEAMKPAEAAKSTITTRAGQGQQLSLPVTQAKKVHGLDLVERMNQFEMPVTKK